MSKWKATIIVRTILLASPEIAAAIKENIFPLVAPKNTEGDFIVIQRDKYSKIRSQMGVANEDCQVFVNIVSDDYDRSYKLAELVDRALEGEHNGLSIQLMDSTEDFESDKFIQVLLFKLD